MCVHCTGEDGGPKDQPQRLHGATCKVGPPPRDAWGLKSEEEGTGQGRACCCDPLRSHRSPRGGTSGPRALAPPWGQKGREQPERQGLLGTRSGWGAREFGFVHTHEEGPETTVILGSGPNNSQNQLVMITSSI